MNLNETAMMFRKLLKAFLTQTRTSFIAPLHGATTEKTAAQTVKTDTTLTSIDTTVDKHLAECGNASKSTMTKCVSQTIKDTFELK